MKDGTRVVRAGLPEPQQGEPLLPGPVFAAPFHLRGDPAEAEHVYTRYGNPTWERYEAALVSAAASAPAANGARKNPIVAISPTASTTAAISQSTHGSMRPNLQRGAARVSGPRARCAACGPSERLRRRPGPS